MTTAMRLLPVRTTPKLRTLIESVGSINAATRALLIIGAASANLNMQGFEREIAQLLAEELDHQVLDALYVVYCNLQHAPAAAHLEGVTVPWPAAETMAAQDNNLQDETMGDPFDAIGIEV